MIVLSFSVWFSKITPRSLVVSDVLVCVMVIVSSLMVKLYSTVEQVKKTRSSVLTKLSWSWCLSSRQVEICASTVGLSG